MQLQEESDMEEESRKSFAQITLYNQLIKEMDDLYRVYAKTVICRRRLSGSCIASGSGKKRLLPRGRSAAIGSTRLRQ